MKTIIIIAGYLLTVSAGWAGSNLVANGHFDDTNGFLPGWKYNYEDTGNELLASNHVYVAVTNEGARKHVLALRADGKLLSDIGQGVMVDSAPIPLVPGKRYQLAVSAKTTGPDCRILVEGYRWKPGVKPHANPMLRELRKCYRFAQLYFGAEKAGTMGGIRPSQGWTRASLTFPDPGMTKLAMANFSKIQFLVIHIIAIGGTWNDPDWVYLYIDDVQLEQIP